MNKNDTYNTPDHVFKQLNDIFNFDLDVACDSSNVKCPDGFMFDKGQNGLTESWANRRIFCNPPFSTKSKWIEKAVMEVEKNRCPIVVMVLPLNSMSASSFHYFVIRGGYFFEVLKGRISFLDNDTKQEAKNNNTGTVIVYLKKRILK